MKKIDSHSHLGAFGGWADVSFEIDDLLAQMEEYNIEKTILVGPNFQENDQVAQAYELYPDKLIPLVWVNPALDPVEEKLDEYIKNKGFKGIKLHPLFDAFVADDPVVDPVMDYAQRHDLPVFIHSGHPPFSLPWSIALLAERYPEVSVVMVHMGHGHGVYIQAAIDMAKRYDNIYLEMSGMPMESKILEAYKTVGSDRVLFGIDSPFHHPSIEIQKVGTSGLSQEEQADVFYNNIKQLMNL